nr:MAG TPA: Prokaryotic membrane lipoprotein lipid attachment site [Caudoviricetes sp.]
MKKLLFAAVTSAVMCGCTTTYGFLEPCVNTSTQEMLYSNGQRAIVSKLKNTAIIVVPNSFKSGERMRVYVQTANRTNEKFDFDSKSVSADTGSLVERKVLRVYTYDDLVAEERSRQAWAAFAIALSGVSNSIAASNAGYSYTTGTYSGSYGGNIYSPYGPSSYGYDGTYSGTYSGTTYNPYISQLAQQQATDKMTSQLMSIESKSNSVVESLGNSILRYNTVYPNSICGGQVEIDAPTVNEKEEIFFWLDIETGADVHEFKFKVHKLDV